MLFKIGRKLSTSGAISSVYEIYNPPIAIKVLFFIIGFNFGNKKNYKNLSAGTKLCEALQGMGTTFIKLGQFLATRPDIIGEDISKELEKLQDKLPAFDTILAKYTLKIIQWAHANWWALRSGQKIPFDPGNKKWRTPSAVRTVP